jgi:hypothetical protein
MLRPIVVLWLAAPGILPDHRADIVEWAEARGRRPVWPDADLATLAYDRALAEEVEALLEEARSASPGERSAFDRLEQLLISHPELPQAPWWMAERHAIEAQRAESPPEAVDLARLLEGPRAAAFGLLPRAAVGPSPHSQLRLAGVRANDRVLLDGVPLEPNAQLEAGRHHVQVFREQRRISAAWIALGASPAFELVDPTEACSELDLLGTRDAAAAPEPSPGVLCSEWAVARPTGGGATSLAYCRGSSCAPWQTLEAPSAPLAAALPEPALADDRAGLPPWLTWGAVGVGSVVAAGLILWQAGAFDGPASDTEFTFTGPTAVSF